MACVNPVPKLYRSVIEDVIEGVRDLFAEEGIEEHVLKDLKQEQIIWCVGYWEYSMAISENSTGSLVTEQSAATGEVEDAKIGMRIWLVWRKKALVFYEKTSKHFSASLVIPAGRTLPSFTTAELGTSNSSANFTFPGYPIHVPAGVTLQTVSGHLYKVNVPIMVTQTSGGANILQHPIQHVFQQLGQPSVIQTGVPRLNPCSLQATTEKAQRMDMVLQQPAALHSGPVDKKHLENASSDTLVPPGNEPKLVSEALLSQQGNSQFISLPGVTFPSQVSQTDSNVEPVLGISDGMTQNLHGGPLTIGPLGALHQHMTDVQLHVLKNPVYDCESVKQPRNTEEASSIAVSQKGSNSQMDLSIQVTGDYINEIIQIDGTDDTSSNEEIESIKDVDENEFLGITDAGDRKVLEEADSVSNEDSTANSSDNEDHHIDIVEEDPLNSGDDVSEQDVPDLFDTDNVIVCQYDKVHRSKNKWKFYLKDGVMCFGGRDYVFAKAIGDAEW